MEYQRGIHCRTGEPEVLLCYLTEVSIWTELSKYHRPRICCTVRCAVIVSQV